MADRNPVGPPADGRGGVVPIVVERPEGPDWRDDPGGGGDGDTPTDSIAPRPRRKDPRSRTLTAGGNGEIVPIVYGRDEVGAKFIFAGAVGPFVYGMLVLGEGPWAGMESPRFGDSSQTTFAALGLVENVDWIFHAGTPDQGIDPILAASKPAGFWKWAFPSTAYLSLKYNALADAFLNVDPKTFRCLSRGRMLIDHRVTPTMEYADRIESENNALATLDFTRSQRFGMGAEEKEIGYDSFDEAADDCDQVTATLADSEPSAAPDVEIFTAGLGRIENGIYGYAETFVDTDGVESILSPWSADITVSNATPSRIVRLYSLEAGGASIAFRRLYRRRKRLAGDAWGSARRIGTGDGIPIATTSAPDTTPTWELGGSPPISSSVVQFRIGLWIGDEETVGETIDQLRSTFTAYFVFNNGAYQCHVDKARTATGFTWDASKISGTPTLRRRDPSEIPSQVVVNFVNAAQGWKPDSASWPPTAVPVDGVRRLDRLIEQHDVQGIPTYDQALRIAKWFYYRATAGLDLEFQTHQMGALPVPMSIIEVGHGRFGLSASDWTVIACGPTSRERWTIRAEAQITYDTGYHVDPGTTPGDVDPPPDPGQPPAPSDSFVLIIGTGLPFGTYDVPPDGG